MIIRMGLACLGVLLLLLVVGCDNGVGVYGYDYDEYGPYYGQDYGAIAIGPAYGYSGHEYRGGHDEHGFGGHNYGERGNGGGGRVFSERGNGGGGEHFGGGGGRGGGGHHTDYLLTGRGVRPTASPIIDEFNLSFNDVQYQPKPFHVTHIGSTTFSARMTDTAVNAYVNKRAHSGVTQISQVHFTFAPGVVQATMQMKWNGQMVTAVSTGTLQPSGAQRLLYLPSTCTVNNVPVPAEMLKDISNQLNPLTNLQSLHCAPQIHQVSVSKGAVIFTGSAVVKNIP